MPVGSSEWWMSWTELSLHVLGGALTQTGKDAEEKSTRVRVSGGVVGWRQPWSADSCPKLWVDHPPDLFLLLYLLPWMRWERRHSWVWRRRWSPVILSGSKSPGCFRTVVQERWWASKEGTEIKLEEHCAINVSSVSAPIWLEAVLLVFPASVVGSWGSSRQPRSMAGHPYYSSGSHWWGCDMVQNLEGRVAWFLIMTLKLH